MSISILGFYKVALYHNISSSYNIILLKSYHSVTSTGYDLGWLFPFFFNIMNHASVSISHAPSFLLCL